MPLNPRQQKFVEGYLAGKPAYQAYKDAGYTPKTDRAAESAASRMLGNVEIADAISQAREAAAERAVTTAEWVLGRLRVEALRTGDGATHGGRVRALELLGKPLGLFKDQVELTGANGGPLQVDLRRLTDDQLATLDALLGAAAVPALPGGGPGGDGPPPTG